MRAGLSESKQTVMSAVLGSVGDPAGLLDPDVESILEEKNQLISRQYAEIERLQRELSEVIGERDALLCEVSKFKFEREMTDLTRLLDDRYVLFELRSSQSICILSFRFIQICGTLFMRNVKNVVCRMYVCKNLQVR